LLATLAAVCVALWGCNNNSGGGTTTPAADDDASPADRDPVAAACQTFLAKCNLATVAGQPCSYFGTLAINQCNINAIIAYFGCLSGAGCAYNPTWITCGTDLDSAVYLCGG
jgi:hypothetical protein